MLFDYVVRVQPPAREVFLLVIFICIGILCYAFIVYEFIMTPRCVNVLSGRSRLARILTIFPLFTCYLGSVEPRVVASASLVRTKTAPIARPDEPKKTR